MQAPSPSPSPSVDLSLWLVNQGPLGVGLLLAIFLVARLWRTNEELTRRLDELQNLRVAESKTAGERMERVARSSVLATRRLYRALGEKDDDLDREE